MTEHREKKVALITGATGYLGANLTRRLVNEGWKVHVIVRRHSKLNQIDSIKNQIYIHIHDGTTKAIFSVIYDTKPQIVFHIASLSIKEHQPHDIIPILQSNIVFGTQLVDAMVACSVPCLVNTGTFWQHYQNRNYSPVNLYAATKQAFEDILQFYIESSNIKVITLKLFDFYGPDDPRNKLFSLLRDIVRSRNPLSMTLGRQCLNMVFIDDVVEAYVFAARRLLNGKVKDYESYAVSSMKSLSLRKIVHMYEKEIGKHLNIRWGAIPYRKREVMKPWNRGGVIPGWRAMVSLEEGIKQSITRSL